MSYARFSSDLHRSDFYIYEAADAPVDANITIHVAANRFDFNATPESALEFAAIEAAVPVWTQPTREDEEQDIKAFMDAKFALNRRLSSLMAIVPMRPINHPEAGTTHTGLTYAGAVELLERLINEGLHLPAGVLNELRDEAKSESVS